MDRFLENAESALSVLGPFPSAPPLREERKGLASFCPNAFCEPATPSLVAGLFHDTLASPPYALLHEKQGEWRHHKESSVLLPSCY